MINQLLFSIGVVTYFIIGTVIAGLIRRSRRFWDEKREFYIYGEHPIPPLLIVLFWPLGILYFVILPFIELYYLISGE